MGEHVGDGRPTRPPTQLLGRRNAALAVASTSGERRIAHFHSARRTSTTDLKANHSGISSPSRSILRNLVPESFLTSRPCDLAESGSMYSNSSPSFIAHTKLSDGTGVTPSSGPIFLAKSCASKAP